MNFYSLKVIEKNHTTFNSVFITLEIPKNISALFKYKSGQYVSIKIKDNKGVFQNRCYSICSSLESNHISICIKKINEGVVSSFLFDDLNIGDSLQSSCPEGDFTLDKSSVYDSENIIFISAGSGITPIKSQIESLLHQKYTGNIYLIYANNNEKEIIFYNYFKEIDKKFENFNLILILKDIPPEWTWEQGILTKEKIFSLFKNYSLPLVGSVFYISGPLIIIENSIRCLQQEGISEQNIFKENFFTGAPTNIGSNKVYTTKITANGKEHHIKTNANESILNSSLKAGINVPYSCRTGQCLSCVAKIDSGKIIVQNDSELTEKQRGNDEIITCQSYPTSDNIHIDYDIDIDKSILQDRNKLIAISLFFFLFVAIILLQPQNEQYSAKGEYNTGHEELKCVQCHKDAPGTSRQQIQRNLQNFLRKDVSEVHFGKIPVGNEACISCHIKPNDIHPTNRFMEPKFKEARDAIHPETCISCHAEHSNKRVTIKDEGYCINCHKDVKIINDPLKFKHSELIKLEKWSTCIQCHDFHGNHIMETATTINDTIPLKFINDYFDGAEDPYSDLKKYIVNLDSINTL